MTASALDVMSEVLGARPWSRRSWSLARCRRSSTSRRGRPGWPRPRRVWFSVHRMARWTTGISPGDQRSTSTEEADNGGSGGGPPRVALAGILVGLTAPLVVALVVLRTPRWYPVLELAQTELHVRDVGTSHTPLTGLIGRFSTGQGGSHPGPLSFFALTPIYRLLGARPWALQVATVMLHLAAMTTALWIAHRRGGARLLVLTGVALLVLVRFFGPSLLTEPWNPYLPVLWWVVFVLATWSAVEEEPAFLLLAVFAGSLCAQTHVSYVPLTGGLGAFAVGVILVRAGRHRGPGAARRTLSWVAASVVTGAVLWLPPVVDEVQHQPGNLSLLVDDLGTPPEAPIGLARGGEVLLANLEPWRLLVGEATPKTVVDPDRWPVGGFLYVGAWGGCVLLARRLRQQSILRLDAVLGVALALSLVAATRIDGVPWAWLVLWAWGLGALLGVATLWTLAAAADARVRTSPPARMARRGAVAVMALVATTSFVRVTRDAAYVEPDAAHLSVALSHLVPPTAASLEGYARRPGDGDPRYLVTWLDPVGVVGADLGFGLVNELDRNGLAVGTGRAERLRAAPHLAMRRSEADAAVLVVTGPAIDRWTGRADVRHVAAYDPRSPEQRHRQERLRARVKRELRRLGHPALADLVETNLLPAIFQASGDPDIPRSVVAAMVEILRLGVPSAVFVGPQEAIP